MIRRPARRAVVSLWFAFTLLVLLGFVGLASDTAYVYSTGQKLQAAADAAALAAVPYITYDQNLARTKATNIAAANTAGGAAVQLAANPSNVATGDAVIGTFSGGTFTPTTVRPNAIKVLVRAELLDRRQAALPLIFGPIAGISTSNVSRFAIAQFTPSAPMGIIAYNGFNLKNNFFFGSYNSSVTVNPNTNAAQTFGSIGSNGAIDGKNNNDIWGNVMLGPSGTQDGLTIHGGTTINVPGGIPLPTMPSWSPATNPNGIPQVYTVSSNTTLPGGEYWFTSLTINSALTFSGPATIYVNGNIILNTSLTAYQSLPANLKIYQLGANRTFGPSGASGSNHMDIVANIWAPTSDYSTKNNDTLRGAAIFNTISSLKNNAEFWYDNTLSSHGKPYLVQ